MVETWFEKKLEQFKDDPEYLREYIDLLNGEVNALQEQNKALRAACEIGLCEIKSTKEYLEETVEEHHDIRLKIEVGALIEKLQGEIATIEAALKEGE